MRESAMKIILAVSSMETGGAERVASTLVNSWAERGDDVTLVVTYSGRGGCFYPVSGKVRVVYLADLVDKKRGSLINYVRRLAAFRKLIQESRADVLVSFLTNVNISSILATRGMGVPVVACEHTDPSVDGRPVSLKMLCRLVYPMANSLTFLSENIATPFRKWMPEARPVAVIPNPIDDELYLQTRVPSAAGARKRLISVGRLQVLKQYDLLIQTFASLATEFPDWDLWIWGDGPERESLGKAVTSLGMEGRIFLPGRTQTPWQEMSRSDAYVLSSRFEGLPMALMEGMALGLPAVAFDCRSGPRELMRGGEDGLLVPPGDVDAMKTALRRLLSDEALRAELGQKGAASIRERYSVSAVLRIWDELFLRLQTR
jgi:glycosyltransferase involved in cell wall biosynthesis